MGDLDHKVEGALQVRDDVERVLSLEGPVAAVRSEAEALRARSPTCQKASAGSARSTTTRSRPIGRPPRDSRRSTRSTRPLRAAWKRPSAASRASSARSIPCTQATESIPSVQHQLAVLKSLADHLAQKTTSLEQQREAVDRAAGQISKLTVMDRELDTWLRRQEEQIRRFAAIETRIADVQALNAKVMARRRGAADRRSRRRRPPSRPPVRRWADLREQMRKSSEGFELENRGLHAVSERVADLRGAVKECEARFAVLDAASQGAAAVQAQVRSAHRAGRGRCRRSSCGCSDEARRIAVMREHAEQLETIAGDTRGADAADRGPQAAAGRRRPPARHAQGHP